MAGTCLYNDSVNINLAETNPDTDVKDENGNTYKFYVIQHRGATTKPGVYVRPYVERDRICIQVLIDAKSNITNNNGA